MKGMKVMAHFEKYETNKGTRWRVSYYIGSKLKKKSGFLTKKEAIKFEAEEQRRFDINGIVPNTNIKYTLKEVVDLYLPLYELEVKESTYYQTFRLIDANIIPHLGDIEIRKITTQKIQQVMLNHWVKTTGSYSLILNHLKKIFAYAMDVLGTIGHNPCDKVKVPRKKPKPKITKVISKEQILEFLSILDDYISKKPYPEKAYMFYLMVFTGLRACEVTALEWSDINFDEKTISIKRAIITSKNGSKKIDTPKTTSSIRTIHLDEYILDKLKQWRATQAKYFMCNDLLRFKTTDFVFCRKNLSFNDTPSAYFFITSLCERYNFQKVGTHFFRHAHCTLLVEAGVDIKTISERLGHSTTTTTLEIYNHVTASQKEESVKQFTQHLLAK